MSSGDIIVKRRPSRPLLHPEPLAEAQHEEAHYPAEEAAVEHRNYHHDEEEEEAQRHERENVAVPCRRTCKPSAVVPHHEVGTAEEESDDKEAPSQPFEDGSAEADEEAAYPDGIAAEAAAPPPPQPMKTARPCDTRAKKIASAKNTKGSKKAAKDAEAATSGATVAAKPAAPKKKSTRRVNLANVENEAPLPEGVNTPRSLAVCEKHGVNPSELAPYPKEHFQGEGVADEVAELRYHSYEKRRQARMAELMPAYRVAAKHSSPSPREKAARAAVNEGKTTEGAAEAEEALNPTKQPLNEEETMRRQFEEQHQRLLEQERLKANNGGYDNDGYRRASVRPSYPRGTSPRAGAASSTSPGCYSAGASRPTVDQPYSAIKIYSHSITEARPLTQSEAVMIDDINEREARRLDTQERAVIIQENKQLMYVERELEKQRRATANVRAKAHERERIQQEHFRHGKDRYYEAVARRQRLEEERQAKLQESIAEKEGHIHANDPYASLLSRRRQSGSPTRRGSSNPNLHVGQPAPAHDVEAEEL